MHDLDHVALGQGCVRVTGARDDLSVALHRDWTAGEIEQLDQPAHRGSILDLSGLAVDGDPHESVLVGVAVAAEIERPRPTLILFERVRGLSRRAAIGVALVVARA